MLPPFLKSCSPLRILVVIIITLGLWLMMALPALANPVDVYFFHSATCPHCREQMPLMQSIAAHNDDVHMHLIEVHEHPDIWMDYRTSHQIPDGSVPRTAIDDRSFIGYSANDGSLTFSDRYGGYIGYRNQIIQAIAAAVGHPLQIPAESSPS